MNYANELSSSSRENSNQRVLNYRPVLPASLGLIPALLILILLSHAAQAEQGARATTTGEIAERISHSLENPLLENLPFDERVAREEDYTLAESDTAAATANWALVWSSNDTDLTLDVDWGDWDNDGDPDLAVGNAGQHNLVYENDSGVFSLAWSSTELDNTRSVAWGDWDNDGDLDLAVGNLGANRIYTNSNGSLSLAWTFPADDTHQVQWGDWDNDNDLDLAVGNWNQPNKVYTNSVGSLTLAWSSPEWDYTVAIDWGDYDDDGYVDLAVGNEYGINRVYKNLGGVSMTDTWSGTVDQNTQSVAWGDWDNDGDLDLTEGNLDARNRIYENENGSLSLAWLSPDTDKTNSLKWADWDGDGDFDLAVGNDGQPNQVYDNQEGALVPIWSSLETDGTKAIDWADVNSDGLLDFSSSSWEQSNRVYQHIGNRVDNLRLTWTSTELDWTSGVAWGDWDNDGDLDLAVGNDFTGGIDPQPTRVYRNDNNKLVLAWSSLEREPTKSIAWGDWDNDGDLDLAVGNEGPDQVYLNENQVMYVAWTSSESDYTEGMAWADYDQDGDLDLAAGSHVYRNVGQSQLELIWTAAEGGGPVAWGDWDRDGYLDLAINGRVYEYNGQQDFALVWEAAEGGGPVAWGDLDGDDDLDLAINDRVYKNEGPSGLVLVRTFPESGGPVSWGDWDGDMDLDLAVGGRVYQNEGQSLRLVWKTDWNDPVSVRASAWGDWDNDGDLDLVVSFSPGLGLYENIGVRLDRYNEPYDLGYDIFDLALGDWDGDEDLDLATDVGIYQNDAGVFNLIWNKYLSNPAWGDWDADGDLDLADSSGVYRNDGQGDLPLTWSPAQGGGEVAWADWDGDADLDLVMGNKIFLNTETHNFELFASLQEDNGESIALGDWDQDGDPDWALGKWNRPIQIYGNAEGTPVLEWSSDDIIRVSDLDWGDMDRDGDLDLAVGVTGRPDLLFENKGDATMVLAWSSPEADWTYTVSWGDWDNDGDLDLAVGSEESRMRIYENIDGSLELTWTSTDIPEAHVMDWGDIDGDGDLDLGVAQNGFTIRANRTSDNPALLDTASVARIKELSGASSSSYASSIVLEGPTIPITYTLFDKENDRVRFLKASFSLDGGSRWLPAVAATGTFTENLEATSDGRVHVYYWDVYASNVLGASDNVIFRLDVYQGFGGPGLYQYSYKTETTLPFRLRGSQVRVLLEGEPAAGARVYRRPVGSGNLFTQSHDGFDRPFLTNPAGYLQGYGEIGPGDQLVAMVPITGTGTYTLYHTNATPTDSGLDAYTVMSGGVQTLTVSSENPLILFNLLVSLEWDARQDPSYTTQLERDIQRASQILYDLTNGRAALGKVHFYHDKGYWGQANVVIKANNNQRPSAMLGGSVLTPTSDIGVTGVITDAYLPGQVRIGPTWNRFGNPDGTLGEDWPRVLAHELGHYLLFLPDNYLGLTDEGKLKLVDCQGSAMTDPYDEAYSEFLLPGEWTGDCLDTVAERYLGRSDWETISHHHPWLADPPANTGPSQLPLAVTEIEPGNPPYDSQALAAPYFNLIDTNENNISVPEGRGQVYLFKNRGEGDPTDDYLIYEGAPVGDLVQARGAAPGDRLCVFDYSHEPLRLGCLDPVGSTPSPLTLYDVPGWEPQIWVTGIATDTVVVTVTNVTESGMMVQLLPALGAASDEVAMTQVGADFVKEVTAEDGAYYGHVRVWVPGSGSGPSNPLKEMVVEYTALEAWTGQSYGWGGQSYGWGDPEDSWGGQSYGWGGQSYGWGGQSYGWGAPVMSGDGQVSVYALRSLFGTGTSYTLQGIPQPPALPSWLTLVGTAYRLAADGPMPESAILFRYLAREVPAGQESNLRIYYSSDEGLGWQRLETELDTIGNHASAEAQGEGIYALISTVEMPPFVPGWNNFGYPIQGTRAVTEALAAIDGYYTSVYHYDPALAESWQLHDATVHAPFKDLVNTLETLNFGQAYWLYATDYITLYLGVESDPATTSMAQPENGVPFPPATFYGWITPTEEFVPTEGMLVSAEIDGVVCGQTNVVSIGGKLAYKIQVSAETITGPPNGCGTQERNIVFKVGDWVMDHDRPWNNSQAQLHSWTRAMKADFSANPTSGPAPLAVSFTNLSKGGYDTCHWSFGDGTSSGDCADPGHVYSLGGVYTVSLTIGGLGSEDTETKVAYIAVYGPPVSNFSGSPNSGLAPLTVGFTNLSTGHYDTCNWVFGDGSTSSTCGESVQHLYLSEGIYTVSLTVSGQVGNDTMTRDEYITVLSGYRTYMPIVLRNSKAQSVIADRVMTGELHSTPVASPRQIAETGTYAVLGIGILGVTAWYTEKRRQN